MKPLKKIYILFLGLILFLVACESPFPEEPTGFTFEDENELGEELHEAMVESSLFKVLSDEPGTTYYAAYQYLSGLRVQILATDLLERRRDFDWKIYILEDDDNQRCFTTVGGRIYVTTGLLRDMVANEAELLGVLAHEMYYSDLSYHMDIIENLYNFNVILDVKHGGSNATGLEMVGAFYDTPRDANLVPQADQFAGNIICSIGGTSITAFGNVIENAALTTPKPIWYINHPTPTTSSVADRKGELNALADPANCSSNNEAQVNFDRYLDFLNNLPPR